MTSAETVKCSPVDGRCVEAARVRRELSLISRCRTISDGSSPSARSPGSRWVGTCLVHGESPRPSPPTCQPTGKRNALGRVDHGFRKVRMARAAGKANCSVGFLTLRGICSGIVGASLAEEHTPANACGARSGQPFLLGAPCQTPTAVPRLCKRRASLRTPRANSYPSGS